MKIQRFSVFLTTDDGMIEAEARPSEFGVSVGLHYNKDNRSQSHNSEINFDDRFVAIQLFLIASGITPDIENTKQIDTAVLFVKSLAEIHSY